MDSASGAVVIVDRSQWLIAHLAASIDQVWAQQSAGFTLESWLALVSLGLRSVTVEFPDLTREPRLLHQAIVAALELGLHSRPQGGFAKSASASGVSALSEFRLQLIKDLDLWGLSLVLVLLELFVLPGGTQQQQDMESAVLLMHRRPETKQTASTQGGVSSSGGSSSTTNDAASAQFRMSLVAFLQAELPLDEGGWLETDWPTLIGRVVVFLEACNNMNATAGSLSSHNGATGGVTGGGMLSARAKSYSTLPGAIHSVSGGSLGLGTMTTSVGSGPCLGEAGAGGAGGGLRSRAASSIMSSSAMSVIKKLSRLRRKLEAIACLRALFSSVSSASIDKVTDLLEWIHTAMVASGAEGGGGGATDSASAGGTGPFVLVGAAGGTTVPPGGSRVAGASDQYGIPTLGTMASGTSSNVASAAAGSRSNSGPPLVVVIAGPTVTTPAASTCCGIL
jgi:hypothetical protein